MRDAVKSARAALRETLISLAEDQIAKDGLASLRARDLARDAGCSVGAIYNAAGDIPTLTLEVNARTFRRLGRSAAEAAEATRTAPPPERLRAMGRTYLTFACAHTHLWHALFNFRLPEGAPVPDWYSEELNRLFDFITEPLAELHPDMGTEALTRLTTTLFSSVHGIVLLGLENRVSSVPQSEIAAQIDLLLTRAI